jgi:dynein light chain LC8-type
MSKSKKSKKIDIGHDVKQANMSQEMQDMAVKTAKNAISKALTENKIARQLQETFLDEFGGLWHCIVGRDFQSFVSHEVDHFVYFYIGPIAIMLWKAG